MLIFNMIAKAVGVYTFLRFYKELEAGSLRPHDVPSLKRGSGRGSGAAYDKAPMLSGEERGPVGSPSGEQNEYVQGKTSGAFRGTGNVTGRDEPRVSDPSRLNL